MYAKTQVSLAAGLFNELEHSFAKRDHLFRGSRAEDQLIPLLQDVPVVERLPGLFAGLASRCSEDTHTRA